LRRSSSLSRTGPAAVTVISRRRLRDRIIQDAQDALDFLAEALRIARAIVNAEKHPDEAVVVLDDDHIGVLSRIIRDHASPGLTITERNLAEGIDQVVTRTLTRSWDNADARSRGVRRATRRLPPVHAQAGRGTVRLHRRLHRSPLPRRLRSRRRSATCGGLPDPVALPGVTVRALRISHAVKLGLLLIFRVKQPIPS